MRKLPITSRREEAWLEAVEQGGYTTAQVAEISQVSVRYVQRLIARARASRNSSSSSSETPRLELRLSPNPRECSHSRTSRSSGQRWVECLDCDRTSSDGGKTWIDPSDCDGPRLTVLVPDHHGHGLRKQKMEPWPCQRPPDPKRVGGLPKDRSLRGGRK
jgi:hypothetical protein